MNYRVIANDGLLRILKTGEAVGGNVFGDLKSARAALKASADEEVKVIRACRDEALRTPERELLIEAAPESGIDILPAPSEAGPLAEARIQDAVGRDDLTDIGFLRRT